MWLREVLDITDRDGIVVNMPRPQNPAKAGNGTRRDRDRYQIEVSDKTRRRLKSAAALEGVSYATMIEKLLDLHDDRERRRIAAMAHPLKVG